MSNPKLNPKEESSAKKKMCIRDSYKTNNYYALLMKGGMTHDPVLEKDR